MESRQTLYSRQALIGVPALTLLNPWGLAIARYGKDIENRTWRPTGGVTRFLIHAGKGFDPDGMRFLRQLGYEDALAYVVPSAIIAVADLIGVCSAFAYGRECTCASPWAAMGQVHWRLGNVVPLATPVPCRGAQRLWMPPDHVLDAVAVSLAELAWEPLVCRGRGVDGWGRPIGSRHGLPYPPLPGETPVALDCRARTAGWKVAPRPAAGGAPDAMCSGCAGPSSTPSAAELASMAELRGRSV